MAEVFEGKCVDWNKFNAKDALAYTKEAQKELQRQEYINIIKEIAYTAKLGYSKLNLSKKLSDYTISELKNKGFDISCQKKDCYTITSTSEKIEECMLYTTTIKW